MAGCGWVTVAVGSQLGSQLGYPGHPANPSECSRLMEAAAGTLEMKAAEPRAGQRTAFPLPLATCSPGGRSPPSSARGLVRGLQPAARRLQPALEGPGEPCSFQEIAVVPFGQEVPMSSRTST